MFLAVFASRLFAIRAPIEKHRNTYCGVPSARLPGGRTDLIRKGSIFAAAGAEAPPHDLRVGRRRCTDLAFPNAPEDGLSMRTPLLHHSIVARAVKVLRALRMMGLYRNWRLAYRNRLGTEIPHERVVYRLRSGAQFEMQAGPHDVRVLNEVWLDRIYEPTTDFRVLDGWTVVDLGAHKGAFTVRAALSGRRTKVHAVEPIPTNLECLYRNIALNELNNVSVVEGVVSSSDGDFFLGVNRFSSGASSLLIDRDLNDRIRVRGVSLDELLRPLSTRIDLVKIDIEGAELDVLCCTSSDTLARIRRIVLEYHATPSESAEDVGKELKTLLAARDFRCGEVPDRRSLFAVRF